MKLALAINSLSVGIDASCSAFMYYRSGIIDEVACPQNGVNHAINIIGWGHNATLNEDYWIIRNSWGTSWGESGYVRFKVITGNGVLGINNYVSYPDTN
jgi:C1A family cysteine protease